MRIAILIIGLILILTAFCFLSIKKLTVDIAAMWGISGIFFMLAGAISPVYTWIVRGISGEVAAVLFFGVILLPAGLSFSLSVSRLVMKNHELAIEVSLLKQENERIMRELDKILTESGKND